MNEEQHFKEHPEDNPQPETVSSNAAGNFSSASEENKSSSDEAADPLAIIPQPSTSENMEVHHHGHVHEKKKWKEYLFQFFMLFLAVFCGFLAEYQLEHKIELERTEKHMHTMVQNLKYDTTRYGANLRRNVEVAKGLDSFRYEIKQAIAGNVIANKLYYYFWKYARGYSFPIINDAAISQLKSSGMVRMIKSDSLVNEIGDYYNRQTTTLNNSRESIIRIRTTLNEVVKQVFSYKDFDEFIERETTYAVTPDSFNNTYFTGLLTREPALQLLPGAESHLEQLYTEIAIYQITLRNFNSFIRYNHKGANSLMKHIKEAYHFK
jgi:hypothetical protein